MKRLAWAIAALLLAVAPRATASSRLAVFILADEALLSNDLSEVAIASLAEKPGYELLGLRELEGRLSELETVKSEGLRACLALPACLSEVGAMAGVERAVVGDVRREPDHFHLDLTLFDGKTGAPMARHSHETALDLDALIAAVQRGVFELVPEAPVAHVESPPAPRPSDSRAEDKPLPHEKKPHQRSVVPYFAYGTAALAVVAFSAAAVTGTIGAAHPVGATRAEVQQDVERRQGYASLANGLLVTGGVLASASVVCFIVPWD
jgi:hypothetical protein